MPSVDASSVPLSRFLCYPPAMDFAYTKQERRFRKELRDFLAKEVPPDIKRRMLGQIESEDGQAFQRDFVKKLVERDWMAVSWPKDYGGQAKPAIEQLIYSWELSYYHMSPGSTGMSVVGPTLIHFGTDEQKKTFLPLIARGEVNFCLGYTEPNAGSDLASLQTRADRDGDDWVINGQKIFTSGAERADYCWLAARTDQSAPKHKGISMFLVDMKLPGISIQPLVTLAGYRTNITYWDNVRVPAGRLVGEVNRGWYYAAAALDFERIALFPWGRLEFEFDELVRYCKETRRGGKPLSKDFEVRKRIAALSIELGAMKLLAIRTAWMIGRNRIPNYEASMLKMFATEFQQRLSNAGMQIAGLFGLLPDGAPRAALDGLINYRYRYAVMPTFGGGSSELMRNIIAQRGLGLPR